MLQTLHTLCIFFSIAGIRLFVECGLQPCPSLDLFQQLGLGPAVAPERPGDTMCVPGCLHSPPEWPHLRPAQLLGPAPAVPAICVGSVELPYPAQVSGGEARRTRGSWPGDTQRPLPPRPSPGEHRWPCQSQGTIPTSGQFGLRQGGQGLVIPFHPQRIHTPPTEVSPAGEYHIFLGELLA